MNLQERIVHGYFFAKQYVINKGFASELDWQNDISLDNVTEEKLLSEFSWVILCSGISEKIIRDKFKCIKEIMYDFKSADLIVKNRIKCVHNSLKVFNHKGKIEAIIFVASYFVINSVQIFRYNLLKNGVSFLQTFPYIGEATCYHIAKNIGFDLAKPDRHLVKISQALGYESPQELCTQISLRTDEKVCLVDLVIWRYATLDKQYLKRIEWYFKHIKANA